MSRALASLTMQRIEALAQISEDVGKLTRTFASPAMRRANELVGGWMREAGMSVRTDAIGNLIGHYPAATPDGKILLLGSHLDTVRDAGKFDGPLGVLVALACVHHLHQQKVRLPFAIEVIGFADEEGVRYQSTYLGSRALAGTFNLADLNRFDARGVRLADALREFGGNPDGIGSAKVDASRLLGYAEVHIEQGPVLEQRNLAVGVVSAIAGQTRARVSFVGEAGHAGTVPMNLRKDALCAAAEFILAVEALGQNRGGLVATVGEIVALPGATNVIPGETTLSLDVRHPDDAVRERAAAELQRRAEEFAAERGVTVKWEISHQNQAVICDRRLTIFMENAVKRHQKEAPLLASGAGHDAAALAVICPVTMLFVRCKGGISHNPAELATEADVAVAIGVMKEFVNIMRSTVSYIIMFVLFIGYMSGCSNGPGVGCFYVEVAPAKYVPVKFDSEIGYKSDMKIRYERQSVVFKLPIECNTASSLLEFDGKLYGLALDTSSRDRSKWKYRSFRQAGDRFEEIPIKDFPRSIAIFNIWRPGDPSRYGTGIGGVKIDDVEIGRALNPEDGYFVNSYQARLWYMLEVTNSLDTAEREFGGDEAKKFLLEYIAKYKPVHLTSMEMKPVAKKDCNL